MYLKFRIIFTILAAVSVAAAIPIGSIFGFGWAGLCAVFAFVFYGLMYLCKQNQELDERQQKRQQERNKKVEEENTTKTDKESENVDKKA